MRTIDAHIHTYRHGWKQEYIATCSTCMYICSSSSSAAPTCLYRHRTHEWNARIAAQNILTFRSRLAPEYSTPSHQTPPCPAPSHITNPVHKQRNLPNERSTLVRPLALVLMLVCALGPGLCSGDQPSFQTIPLQSGASVVAKYSVFQFRKIYERAVDLGRTRSIAHSNMDKKDFSN